MPAPSARSNRPFSSCMDSNMLPNLPENLKEKGKGVGGLKKTEEEEEEEEEEGR